MGNRRRASGLRREDLAALAGISTDYLTRLEQNGRRSRKGIRACSARCGI
ncbi:helix-turn-helix transcriptional regulator [Lacisediminihabitans profunda]